MAPRRPMVATALALWIGITAGEAATATCASPVEIQQARESIERSCGCPVGRRKVFLRCARRVLSTAPQTRQCRRSALRAVVHSLCGRSARAAVCCEVRGRWPGRIVGSAKKCRRGEICATASRTPIGTREPLFLASVYDRCSERSTCLTPTAGHSVRPDVVPSVPAVPGMDGGPPRPVAAVLGPDGEVEEFVEEEVVVGPAGPAELEAFLEAYGGTVLRDGTVPSIGGSAAPRAAGSSGLYLLRIDPGRSSLDDLDANMTAAGGRGRWGFSSERGARLAALVARERGRGAGLNLVGHLDQTVIAEHPANGGGNLDAANWWWMTEDDDPTTVGDQGLSLGVVHAWKYVKYVGYPPANTPYTPLRVAVLDSGFDLDTATGVPTAGNTDYPPLPLQLDLVDNDVTAGGHGVGFSNCSGPDCWHGQMSFGACCARAGNGFGGAGTSAGWEVVPLLIKVSGDAFTAAMAVRAAVQNGADVINTSLGYVCGWWCRTFQGLKGLDSAVTLARSQGKIVVASAGNQGQDLATFDVYPCKSNGTVCVGALGVSGMAESYSNYGTAVDIWGPACFRTTVTRGSASEDGNATGEDELARFCGTSASSPFVAGVVALMKMLDRNLSYEQVRGILASTANPSPDPKVTSQGYVDAYRAVAAVRPNLPPEVVITQPAAGAVIGSEELTLIAHVRDPETPSPGWWPADFSSTVAFSSSLDGLLCSIRGDATGAGRALGCTAPRLRLGTHTLTAKATDPFGAMGQASITVTVANVPPVAFLDQPPDGAVYYTSQRITLRGAASDSDETIPEENFEWWTLLEGQPLQVWVLQGRGRAVGVVLAAGSYTVSLVVRDSQGASATASVRITVQAGPGYPTAEILQPAFRTVVAFGGTLTLYGSVSDPEDGVLPHSAMQWSSDRDGVLGTGQALPVTLSGLRCNAVTHVVTLRVTDRDGHEATDAVPVTVVDLC